MGKQGILEILNLEDSGPTCAFAIERSRGVLSAAAPEHSATGSGCASNATRCERLHCDEVLIALCKYVPGVMRSPQDITG